MDEPNLPRLADAVRRRREELGLGQADLQARGGPGVTTVGKIERAEIPKPMRSTLKRLDAALEWVPNSALFVLRGGTASPLDEPLPSRDVEPEVPRPGSADIRPVGLGLDAEADGLPPEDVEAIRAQVRALKRARGLSE